MGRVCAWDEEPIHTYICIYIHSYIHTYIRYKHIHIYMIHTHTHTHTVCQLSRDVSRDWSRDYLARHAIARRALGSWFSCSLVRISFRQLCDKKKYARSKSMEISIGCSSSRACTTRTCIHTQDYPVMQCVCVFVCVCVCTIIFRILLYMIHKAGKKNEWEEKKKNDHAGRQRAHAPGCSDGLTTGP